MVETTSHMQGFVCLAAMKGNRLGILAHPDQAEAKIGFSLQLIEIQPDQDPAEQEDRDRRASDRIEDKKKHQLPGDRPENTAERNQLQKRPQTEQEKIQRLICKRVDVFRDSLVRIVDRGAGVQLVERMIAEIFIQVVAGQPAPPLDAKRVPDIVVEGVDRHGCDQHIDANQNGVPESAGIPRGQRGCELPRLLIEQYVRPGLPQ